MKGYVYGLKIELEIANHLHLMHAKGVLNMLGDMD
jgi:hypothetical protein